MKDMVRALCPPWPPATIHDGGEVVAVARVLDHLENNALEYRTSDGKTLFLRLAKRDTVHP